MGSFTLLVTSTPMAPLLVPWEGFLIRAGEDSLSTMRVSDYRNTQNSATGKHCYHLQLYGTFMQLYIHHAAVRFAGRIIFAVQADIGDSSVALPGLAPRKLRGPFPAWGRLWGTAVLRRHVENFEAVTLWGVYGPGQSPEWFRSEQTCFHL